MVSDQSLNDSKMFMDTGQPLFQFPASLTTAFVILYALTSITAVVGNSLVIYVIICRRLKTVTNLYIANLACADVVIGVFVIPFQFQAILLQRWTLPSFMCKASIYSDKTFIYQS